MTYLSGRDAVVQSSFFIPKRRLTSYPFLSKSIYARYIPTAPVCASPATICRTAPAAGTPESRPTGWPYIRTEGQGRAEREIDEGPDDGLGEVVRKAHPAVEAQAATAALNFLRW